MRISDWSSDVCSSDLTACMGRSAVLDIGAAQLVITERTHEPWDLGVFESMGLAPRRARFVLVKSRMYCRPVFEPISQAQIGRASCRARVCQYVLISVVHLSLKKK